MRKKFSKKIRENFFFFDFFRIFFFSVEIFHMMCRLCMQSFMTLGQTVPEIRGWTDTQTDRQISLVILKKIQTKRICYEYYALTVASYSRSILKPFKKRSCSYIMKGFELYCFTNKISCSE